VLRMPDLDQDKSAVISSLPSKESQRGYSALWEERPSRPECRAVPSMRLLPPIKYSIRVSLQASFPVRLRCRTQIRACNPLRSPPSRMESCTRPISCSGASCWNTRIGNTINLRAQYVGTRAVNQRNTTEVNGYQTVCQGCFAPFPYGGPTDPRFAAVTQLSTGANSHYNGLQTTAEKRLGHGLQVQVNYTWSHCIDTVSKGRIPVVLRGRHSVADSWESPARSWPMRLRCAP